MFLLLQISKHVFDCVLVKKQPSLSGFHTCDKIVDNLADTGDLRRKELFIEIAPLGILKLVCVCVCVCKRTIHNTM